MKKIKFLPLREFPTARPYKTTAREIPWQSALNTAMRRKKCICIMGGTREGARSMRASANACANRLGLRVQTCLEDTIHIPYCRLWVRITGRKKR